MSKSDRDISMEGPLIVGQPTVVSVHDGDRPAPGLTVTVTHRPGLSGERVVTIGVTDGLGRVRFTPDSAGTAGLHAQEVVLPVSIGWNSPPPMTITVLLLLVAAALSAIGYGWFGGTRWRSPGPRQA